MFLLHGGVSQQILGPRPSIKKEITSVMGIVKVSASVTNGKDGHRMNDLISKKPPTVGSTGDWTPKKPGYLIAERSQLT